jgi:hypothetical protein
MARKSKADRVNEILKSNPLLKRDDIRINDLIFAEGQLRKAQRAASNSDVLSSSAAGTDKRSPALVALDGSSVHFVVPWMTASTCRCS